ncbi:unnamed protein product [Closterium sp. NIES-54]
MASWKSTSTYVDEVPPPGANIISGMWIFRVKWLPGSPPAFKARYVARGFSQRQGVDFFQTFSPTPKMTTLRVLLYVAAQRGYELHSLDFSTAFLQGSQHKEIWLRRPPGFTGSFPAGTQWTLRRPVYGLRQAPREWHDIVRTTLATLGFAPSTSDPSLFLRTDTTLPPFYVLVYVDDLVFATAHTEALAHVKSELQKRHTCTDLGPSALRLHVLLATVHSSAYRSLALSSTFGQVRRAEWPVHWDAAKRVLRYLCSTSGMGLVLGGRARVVLTGHADASWVDDLATQQSSQGNTFSLGSSSISWRSTRSSSFLSSSCEAEIYAGAMAAQELRWLTYLLADLGEAPRSPPVLGRCAGRPDPSTNSPTVAGRLHSSHPTPRSAPPKQGRGQQKLPLIPCHGRASSTGSPPRRASPTRSPPHLASPSHSPPRRASPICSPPHCASPSFSLPRRASPSCPPPSSRLPSFRREPPPPVTPRLASTTPIARLHSFAPTLLLSRLPSPRNASTLYTFPRLPSPHRCASTHSEPPLPWSCFSYLLSALITFDHMCMPTYIPIWHNVRKFPFPYFAPLLTAYDCSRHQHPMVKRYTFATLASTTVPAIVHLATQPHGLVGNPRSGPPPRHFPTLELGP